ncbi:MAG: hypothetical protein J2P46_17905, partial [Zavarzinella sp.]|nr:hypothetical protein [Zavarzinella sp.]
LVEEAAAAGRKRAVTKPTATNPAAGRAPEAGTKPSGAKKKVPAEGAASGEAAPTLNAATKSKYHRDRPLKSELPAGNKAQIEKPRPKPNQLDSEDLDAVTEAGRLRDLIKQRQALDDAAAGIGAKGAASQKVGEAGAERYMESRMGMAITDRRFKGSSTAGQRQFDSVWYDANTQTYYVVEAKGWGGARRRTKKVGGTAEQPIHAEQGNSQYFDRTLEEMRAPGQPGNEIAEELRQAILPGSGKKVVYMEVTTKLSGGKGPVFSTATYKRWN